MLNSINTYIVYEKINKINNLNSCDNHCYVAFHLFIFKFDKYIYFDDWIIFFFLYFLVNLELFCGKV